MEKSLHIQMFGHFIMAGMGGRLDEDTIRSDMVTKLLAYLVCHRENEVTTQELIETLWHNDRSDNPVGALKNLVYRLRRILEKQWPNIDIILTGRGSYRWNGAVVVRTDAEEFEEVFNESEKEQNKEKKLKLQMLAINIYKGIFLSKWTSEYWIMSLSTYYHSKYLDIVKNVANELEQSGKYEEMGRICNYALQLDRLDEDLNYCYIKALQNENKITMAIEQYKKMVDNLYENVGISPSKRLRSLYLELMHQVHDSANNITTVQKELNDTKSEGAFLCQYGVFKRAYQLEQRRSARLGISVYLALLTIIPPWELDPDGEAYKKILANGMEMMQEILLDKLRAGDVVTKYSNTQYLILLSTCQYDTAKKVINRIETNFIFNQNRRQKIKLSYSLEEMELEI